MIQKILFQFLSCAAVSVSIVSISAAQSDPNNTKPSKPPAQLAIDGAVFEPKVVQLLESNAQNTPSPAPASPPEFPIPSELIAKPISESDIGRLSAIPNERSDSLWVRLRGGFAMPNLDTQLASDKTAWYANSPIT